jgi:hypothetical protein
VAVADGEAHQASDIVNFEFPHDAAAIGIDAARPYAEQRRDFLAGPAIRDELENLDFARTERAQQIRFRIIFQTEETIAGITTGVCRETCTTRWRCRAGWRISPGPAHP